MPGPDADLSATLSGIRERYTASFTTLPGYSATLSGSEWTHVNSADDIPLLLAAIEAVLKLADSGRRIQFANGEQWWDVDPAKVRETITAALSGTSQAQPGEDRES